MVFVLLCNCSDKAHVVVIDNPKQENIKVRIKDSIHEIYGFGSITIPLKSNTYSVSAYTQNDSLFFNKDVLISSDGILNPHLLTYVKWNDLYSVNGENHYAKEIVVNNNTFKNVDFEVYENQYFIPKTWDYNLFEPWKSSIQYYFKKDAIKSKIYRVEDLEKEWGFKLDFETQEFTIKQLDSIVKSINLKIEEFGK